MNSSPAWKLTAISGFGAKGPACFLLETEGKRLLLDLGYGPDPGALPNLDDIGRIDALILSHGHRDHAGGLSLLPKVGNPPIYATESVAQRLPPHVHCALPLRGSADVMGIIVEIGRNGHAPGGIWIRFAVGDGLIYMGDYSNESILYAVDAPPPAAAIIIDASYGGDDTPFARRASELEACLGTGPVLLPVPADGRGPEIALFLARRGRSDLALDEAMYAALVRFAASEHASLRDGVTAELAKIADGARSIDAPRGFMLASAADGTRGTAAGLIAQWEHDSMPAIVFTGYVPPGTPAARLVASGRARFMRWNVHPRLSENVALVRSTQAKTVIPAFCDRKDFASLSSALAPAAVVADTPLVP